MMFVLLEYRKKRLIRENGCNKQTYIYFLTMRTDSGKTLIFIVSEIIYSIIYVASCKYVVLCTECNNLYKSPINKSINIRCHFRLLKY